MASKAVQIALINEIEPPHSHLLSEEQEKRYRKAGHGDRFGHVTTRDPIKFGTLKRRMKYKGTFRDHKTQFILLRIYNEIVNEYRDSVKRRRGLIT